MSFDSHVEHKGLSGIAAIHIGLPKTGTSHLQSAIFGDLESIQLVRGWDTLRSLLNATSHCRVVLSDESIVGRPWGLGSIDRFRSGAEAVRRCFGDVPIVLSVREPRSLALSIYRQYIHEGGTGKIQDFLAIEPRPNAAQRDWLDPDSLCVMPKLEFLVENFSRTFVVDQAILRSDPERVCGEMVAWMGARMSSQRSSSPWSNEGVKTVRSAAALRTANRVGKMTHTQRWLHHPVAHRLGLSPRMLAQRWGQGLGGATLEVPEDYRALTIKLYETDWREACDFVDHCAQLSGRLLRQPAS